MWIEEQHVLVPGKYSPTRVEEIRRWATENNLITAYYYGNQSYRDPDSGVWYDDSLVWSVSDVAERLLFILRWGN